MLLLLAAVLVCIASSTHAASAWDPNWNVAKDLGLKSSLLEGSAWGISGAASLTAVEQSFHPMDIGLPDKSAHMVEQNAPHEASMASLSEQMLFSNLSSQYYVDPQLGSDTPHALRGARESPFRSVATAAMHAANSSRLFGTQSTVWLLPGVYPPLHLSAEHGGGRGAPVVLRGVSEDGRRPLFSGGVSIPSSALTRRFAVFSANLSELGVDLSQLGTFKPGGLGQCSNDIAELYLDGRPLTLARYPNLNRVTGDPEWMQVERVWRDNASYSFGLRRTRGLSSWRTRAWEREADVWWHGYWSVDWADSYVRASAFDPWALEVSVDDSTPPVYGIKPQARVALVNAASELDAEGEFYIDRDSGMLSFMPFADSDLDTLTLSLSSSCVVCVSGTEHLHLRDVDIAYGRGTLLEATSVAHLTLGPNLDIYGGSQSGVSLVGSDSVLVNSSVHDVGCSGVSIVGGDRPTLTASGLELSHLTMTRTARLSRTFTPALRWSGVGHWVHDVSVTDVPHAAVLGSGNDALFERLSIARACFETNDAGAFYSGRNWATRGNVLRYSRFEGIRTREPTSLGSPAVQAIYLDDQMSGWEIYNNTIVDSVQGVLLGGGRHNHVKFNRFERCDTAVHFDSRGIGCFDAACYPLCAGGCGSARQLWGSVAANDTDLSTLGGSMVTLKPWATRYPALTTLVQDGSLGDPVYNEIVGNSWCGGGAFLNRPDDIVKYTGIVKLNTKDMKCLSSSVPAVGT